MPMYSEHLPTRVPEFLQDDETQLYEYLEACGEIFDQFSDTIKEQDAYKDYKKVPEARLSLLARRFAFNPPNNIPDNLLRGIVRDIAGIYTTKGVENSLTWVFRLIGWSSTIEYTWLLNPERYDPEIKTVYPELYEKDGLENDASSFNTFFARIGDNYRIGAVGQQYQDNVVFIVDGRLLIGRNSLISLLDTGNPYTTTVDRTSVDFNKLDYRNFVYGKANDTRKGTFFTGGSYFSRFNNVRDAKIIGEIYHETDITRFAPSVISTPYLVVKVDSEDYDKFTRPYVDDEGNFYSYTDREKFRVAQTIIEYMLYEFVRPANIKIIMVASAYEDKDQYHLNDSMEMDATAVPFDPVEPYPLVDQEASYATAPSHYIGSEHLFIGMTSYIQYSGLMPLESPKLGTKARFKVQDISPGFQYEYLDVAMVENGTTGLFDSVNEMLIRTPSIITVSVPKDAAIYGKVVESSDWEWIQDITPGTHEFRVFDYTLLKVTNYTTGDVILSDGLFDVNMTVTWEDKQEIRQVEWDFGDPAIYPITAI